MDKLINYIMFRKKTYGNIQDYASASSMYSTRICFKSILLDISSDEYLQAMTEILEEDKI